MFYYIKGVVGQTAPNLVVLEAGGVGYALNTSYVSSSSVRKGEQAQFFTYLHVREEIFELYGFATEEELNCFKMLIGISGVGPKAALAILSVVTPSKLALCVISEDEKALTQAQGVGKKLAQRIILELKDKLAKANIGGGDLNGGDILPTAGADGAGLWQNRSRRGPERAGRKPSGGRACASMPEKADAVRGELHGH